MKESANSYSKEDEETDFVRGYRDVPDDHKLRALSYVRLCDLLESSTSGTTAFMVIEAEKRRRDNNPSSTDPLKVVTEVGTQKRDALAPDHWYKKPIPVIAFSVIAGFLLLCLRYIAIHYFGFHV